MRRLFALGALLISFAASAHDADIVYAQLSREPGGSKVREVLTMTPATLERLAPVDANDDGYIGQGDLDLKTDAIVAGVWRELPLKAGSTPCELGAATALLREGFIELRAEWSCGQGDLAQTFRILSVLPSNYRVVLGSYVDGEAGQRFVQGDVQTLVIEQKKEGETQGLGGWVSLGIRHIFGGLDHLAFLLALLLTASSLKRVLLMVTAFTVAHSITLGITALGYMVLSPRQVSTVEILIAVSIIWVAVENLFIKDAKWRPLITFAFGLIHGFGFASSLRGYGIEREAVSALFGFNAGVELGQLAVVLVTVPLVRQAQKRPRVNRIATSLASLAIAAAGVGWLISRAFG